MNRIRIAQIAGGVAVLALIGATLLFVDPAEKAVVFRFGAATRVADAGLNLRLPLVETAERIRVTEVRRVELPQKRLLTGDTNLVEVQLVVQYTVSDPLAYATRYDEPEKVVAAEVSSIATALVARMGVDALLTTGRTELQQGILENAKASIDQLGTGVLLVAVEVGTLTPPAAVDNAFRDVATARSDQETMRLAADSYTSQVLPDVRGRAAQLRERALGDAAATTAGADGDIRRFEALHEAYGGNLAAARVQLREELFGEIGQKVDVRVVPPGAELYYPETP
ncbi:MAG: FtsH protease activity modulator HflK [Myxococcota bacterium]